MNDLRHAFRALRAAPTVTGLALVILALGIGASTAIFSVVDAVVLRTLPFDDPDRLVAVSERQRNTGEPTGSQNAPIFLDWRAGQQVFEGLGAIAGGSGYILRNQGEPKDVRTRRITHDLFPMLRVPPFLGRGFTADNEVDGRHRVALLSYGFWQQQFGGDPGVVGRVLTFDHGPFEVVGVMPPGFTYPLGGAEPSEMWVPYVVPPTERVRGDSRGYYLQLVARLKPGVSILQATAQLNQVTAPIAAQFPDWFNERGVAVTPLHESIVGQVRSWMLMLLGAVGFVLLLASVNVANLMLARALGRQRELGVRAALGGSPWRIARGLLVESLLLSVTGAILGLVVAWTGMELLRSALPATVPRVADIQIDLRVLAASIAAGVGTGVLFGLAPALQFSRPNLTAALRDGGRSATTGAIKQRLRGVLLVGEVALAVVLLVGCGLFLSSFARVMSIDLGFDSTRILTLAVPLPNVQSLFDRPESEREQFADRTRQSLRDVMDRVQALPGVEHAAVFSGAMPLTNSSNTTSLTVSPGREVDVEVKRISSDYHATLGIPLVAGRLLTSADRSGSERVLILNDVAARQFFDGKPALGRVVNIYGQPTTVIGVVGAVRQNGPESAPRAEAYVPIWQSTTYVGSLVIRTRGEPATVLPEIRRAVLDVLPNAAFPVTRTMEEWLTRLVLQRRFNMMLFSLFGLLGLVIAIVGIYGVMAYTVQQRTTEFGVRMALGAPRGRIIAMVLGRAGALMAAGLVLGLGAAFALSRLVAAFLFEVRPGDVVVYATASAVLALTGLIGALLPARRASRVDPMVALRDS